MKHGVGQTQSSDCVESHCFGSTDTAWGHFAYSFLVLELNFLQRYVSESEPIINKQLRDNNANPKEIKLMDSLFEDNSIPSVLYRWIPADCVFIENNYLCDKAYLSCAKDVDGYISHVWGDELACIKIKTDGDVKSLDVNKLLPDANEEGEYILPREITLCVIGGKSYQPSEFQQFLQDVQCDYIRDCELKGRDIHRIRLITTTINKN